MDFTPDKNILKKYYYHKKLNPNDENGWKKGTTLLVRSTQTGADYIIRFNTEGKEVDKSHPSYDKVKNWKYFAEYDILKIFPKEERKRRYIPKKLKDLILNNFNNSCALCGSSFDSNNPHQIDHILEMSCGGYTEESNLQPLCKYGCHELKTQSFKKAKASGIVDPFNWDLDNNKHYFNDFIKKIGNGPLFKKIINECGIE